MTEELNEFEPQEIDLLKSRATDLGIRFSPNIGVDKLRTKVNEKMNPDVDSVEDVKSKVMAKNQKRQQQIKDARKLVRVRVMNMNPNKKDWKGEVFTVANAVVGTIRRFVPYDVEWHCEDFILQQIKARKMSRFYTVMNDKGMKIRKYRLVPEFSVEELIPLTSAELKALADDQKKRGAIDED